MLTRRVLIALCPAALLAVGARRRPAPRGNSIPKIYEALTLRWDVDVNLPVIREVTL